MTKGFLKKVYDRKRVYKFLEEKKFLTDLEDELNAPLSQSFTSRSQRSHSNSARSKSASQTRKGGKKRKSHKKITLKKYTGGMTIDDSIKRRIRAFLPTLKELDKMKQDERIQNESDEGKLKAIRNQILAERFERNRTADQASDIYREASEIFELIVKANLSNEEITGIMTKNKLDISDFTSENISIFIFPKADTTTITHVSEINTIFSNLLVNDTTKFFVKFTTLCQRIAVNKQHQINFRHDRGM
jgi:hypothetical protein